MHLGERDAFGRARCLRRGLQLDASDPRGGRESPLAARMETSQAAVARLEAGGVGATLTTLQKVASALGLKVTVDLTAAS